jgi:predicted dinucleotide-utilizing enzyme
MEGSRKTRVGIVGFGKLGQFLYEKITADTKTAEQFEVCFVWNRTSEKMTEAGVPANLIASDLDKVADFKPDIIAEVAHPSITEKYGPAFVRCADYFVGSPTAFADASLETKIREAAASPDGHGVYIPSGALWAAEDIKKMADGGSLRGVTVTMKKHPASLKVNGHLNDILAQAKPGVENVIFEGSSDVLTRRSLGCGTYCLSRVGSVRDLCPLAPNNVNTMACAALAGHNLGFDQTRARLVADDRLDSHVIVIEVYGPETPGYGQFVVRTERINPAPPGQVTGQQTYLSFLSSLKRAQGRGKGFHFC